MRVRRMAAPGGDYESSTPPVTLAGLTRPVGCGRRVCLERRAAGPSALSRGASD